MFSGASIRLLKDVVSRQMMFFWICLTYIVIISKCMQQNEKLMIGMCIFFLLLGPGRAQPRTAFPFGGIFGIWDPGTSSVRRGLRFCANVHYFYDHSCHLGPISYKSNSNLKQTWYNINIHLIQNIWTYIQIYTSIYRI